MKAKIKILIAAAVALAAAASAFDRNPGGDAGTLSGWGLGARAEALGRAYTAVADDASSTYWNPAGLAALGRTEVAFAYGVPFADVEDVTIGNAAVAKPLLYSMGEEAGGAGSLGTLAAALAYRGVGGIYEANETGPTGRTFTDADVELELAYAHALGTAGAFGLVLKNITRNVDDYSDSGFGLDLGGRYEPVAGLTAGVVVRNVIAPNFRLKAYKDAPPLTLELGAAYDVFGLAAPCATFEVTREGFYNGGLGVEITPVKYVAIRGGYYAGDETPRAGVGLRLGDFVFDYAMRFGGPLGDSYVASVSVLFGGGPSSEELYVPEEEGYIEYNPEEGAAEEEEEAEGGEPSLLELLEEAAGAEEPEEEPAPEGP
jgi:hypothetical protein